MKLLIASPPCQAWSMAGKRDGERDKALVYRVLADLAAGRTPEDDRSEWADSRSRLVTGPLRWIRDLRLEYDDNACATREAAGLRTLQGDVSALDPREVAAPMNPVRW